MSLSLVIPTRERAEYLAPAIRSALRAADRAPCPVEVVISDNASGDATPEVIASFGDPRIVALRSETRLSMRENFEFALSRCSGSHVVFIGDDDAVLPNGLRILAGLIAAHDPDIINWRILNYLWPDPATGAPGSLKARPHQLDGRLRTVDPTAVLDMFARATFRSYHQGGMIYNGCISRRLIDRAMAGSSGPYFRGSSPDVFTSLQALMVSNRPILRINLPITMGGASPKSNGAAGQKVAVVGSATTGTEFARFIAESARDPYQCRLPAGCQSLQMVILDCLLAAAALHGVTLSLDRAAWQTRIEADVARFSEPARSDCTAMAKAVFQMDLRLPVVLDPEVLTRTARPLAADAPRVRHSASKIVVSGGDVMADAEAAADFLDKWLNLARYRSLTPGFLQAAGQIARLHASVRRFAR